MKTSIFTSYDDSPRSKTLLVPLGREGLEPVLGRVAALAALDPSILIAEFQGFRETWRVLLPSSGPAGRLALLGLGTEALPDALRQSIRRFVFQERPHLDGDLAVDFLHWSNIDWSKGDPKSWFEATIEGVLLGSREVGRHRSSRAVQSSQEAFRAKAILNSVSLFVPPRLVEPARQSVRRGFAVGSAQIGAIELVDAPSNHLTPADVADAAVAKGREHGFSVQVLGKTEIEGEGMGGLLGVNQGSSLPPTFTILDYNPTGLADERPAVGLVGKGVTFDSGGISLKDSTDLSNMKCDMAGAAAVLGAVEAAARIGLKRRVVAAIPATDNKPDACAQNPGDVIRMYNGMTVEVEDTDAEGRLILADALAYLKRRFDPAALIDLATLTGAIYVALGDHAAGLFSNSDDLAERLLAAGVRAHERLWRMPLWKDYDRQIESDVADLKNYGGRPAGAVTAARFLCPFIEGHPAWAHLDIAGVAFSHSEYARHRHATGFGVRVLAEYLSGLE